MRLVLIVAFGVALATSGARSSAASVTDTGPLLTGAAAFGGAEQSAPGVRRLIRPQDLPPPYASQLATNGPAPVPMPAQPVLHLPPGFSARLVGQGYQQPRVIRAAPNGDLFVADSAADEVHVLHFAAGAVKPTDTVFASGFNQPYGIAFYPSGPNPQWVYVANTDSVVRYAYKNGDVKATGAPQTVVSDLPGGYHWTRDIAFIDHDSRMLVAVGSNSNIAEDAKSIPIEGIAAWAASHATGAMWGAEEERADVLSFTPDGGDKQIYATGLRNCSGLAVQPATGAPWCVTNERDQLGDNIPPDFATHLKRGAFYGWPWVLYRQSRRPTRAAEKSAARSRRQGRHAGCSHSGAFGTARHRILRRRHVSGRIQGRRFRGATRFMEPRRTHRLQDRQAHLRRWQADRRVR